MNIPVPQTSSRSSRCAYPMEVRQRAVGLHREALRLFVNSNLSCVEICRRCGVSDGSFAHYLRRGVGASMPNPYCAAQRQATREKYRVAVALYEGTDLSAKAIEQHNALMP